MLAGHQKLKNMFIDELHGRVPPRLLQAFRDHTERIQAVVKIIADEVCLPLHPMHFLNLLCVSVQPGRNRFVFGTKSQILQNSFASGALTSH